MLDKNFLADTFVNFDENSKNAKFLYESIMGMLQENEEIKLKTALFDEKVRTLEPELAKYVQKIEIANVANESIMKSIENKNKEIQEIVEKQQIILEKQEKKKDLIEQISASNEIINHRIEQGSGWTEEQLEERSNLEKEINKVKNFLDVCLSEKASVQGEISKKKSYISQAEEKKSKVSKELEIFQSKLAYKGDKIKSLEITEKALNEKINILQINIQERIAEKEAKEMILQSVQKDSDAESIEMQLVCQKLDECRKNKIQAINLSKKTTKDIFDQTKQTDKLIEENKSRERFLTDQRYELEMLQKDYAIIKKQQELINERMIKIEKQNFDLNSKKEKLKLELYQVEEIENTQLKKEGGVLVKNISGLKKEKDIISRNMNILLKGSDTNILHVDFTKKKLKCLEDAFPELMKTLAQYHQKINDVKNEMEVIDKKIQFSLAKQKIRLDTHHEKEVRIKELEEIILVRNNRLQQEKRLYHKTVLEGNETSNKLIQLNFDIKILKSKIEWARKLTSNTKLEISKIENKMVEQHYHHYKVEKEKEHIALKMENIKEKLMEYEKLENQYDEEIQNMQQNISLMDKEIAKLKKNFEDIRVNRDLLESKLKCESDKLAKANERIKVKRQGLLSYENSIKHITEASCSLEKLLRNMLNEKKSLELDLLDNAKVKQRMIFLEKEIRNEKLRNTAFHEEYEKTFNLHTWRRLAQTDPNKYDMLERVHGLQKQVMEVANEISVKESLVNEKRELYLEHKKISSARPTSESLQIQLENYHLDLKHKQKQISRMETSVDYYKNKVNELKEELKLIKEKKAQLSEKWIEVNLRKSENINL